VSRSRIKIYVLPKLNIPAYFIGEVEFFYNVGQNVNTDKAKKKMSNFTELNTINLFTSVKIQGQRKNYSNLCCFTLS